MPGGIIINGQQYQPPVGAPVSMASTPATPTPTAAAPLPTAPTEASRKLGPTEFKNLTADITKQFNQQGVTDINVINKAIEERFLTRSGADIYLRGNTPTVQSVAQGLGSLVPKQEKEIDPLKTAEPIKNIGQTQTLEKFGLNLADTSLTSIERALLKYTEDARSLAEERKNQAQLKADAQMAGLEGALAGPNNIEMLDKYNEQFKIKETQARLTEISNQINQHKAALQQGIINIEGQPIALEFQLGQKAAIQRQAAATITALSSQGAVVQGELNFARDMVSQYYGAARDDRRNEIDRYKLLFELANDKVIQLGKDEKEALNQQIGILSSVNDRELAEKDKVIELMMKYPDAWAKAGVNLNDDYENIASKVSTELSKVKKGDFQSVEVNGKLFTFDKSTGKYVDSGISVAKQSVGGGIGASDPATDFYVQDFLSSGLSFGEWSAEIGLDTKTKNAIAARLQANPESVIPESTNYLDSQGDEIYGKDLDTGQNITSGNVGSIVEQKRDLLNQARAANRKNPSIMFERRIQELEADIVELENISISPQFTQG